MKSATKMTGIAAAVASLIATGAASAQGHAAEGHGQVALADKSCHTKGGSENKESKKEGKKESEHKEFAGSL